MAVAEMVVASRIAVDTAAVDVIVVAANRTLGSTPEVGSTETQERNGRGLVLEQHEAIPQPSGPSSGTQLDSRNY